MSVFKTILAHDHDSTWVTFRFAHVDDAITTVSYLVSMFCHRVTSIGWPVFKADDDQRVALLKISRSLIELFLPNGLLARKDQSGQRNISASSSSIYQLYQACGYGIKESIPLLTCNVRYYPVLARSMLEILYHHVVTLDRRWTEWKSGSRISIANTERSMESNEAIPIELDFKNYRREVIAITALEGMLAECLTSVMECTMDLSISSLELNQPRLLAISLLFSDQLLLLNVDESGKNVQVGDKIPLIN
jgi:hypothetical protein